MDRLIKNVMYIHITANSNTKRVVFDINLKLTKKVKNYFEYFLMYTEINAGEFYCHRYIYTTLN